MAGNKYLAYDTSTGDPKEVASNDSTAGAGDAGKIVALDSNGRLAAGMMPVGIVPETATIQASENLSAGDVVNIHDSGGARVRRADATNGRKAHGFVLAGVTSGQNATVYFESAITGLSGLTIGADYFLSVSTPGGRQSTPPTGSGQIAQYLGTAYSASVLVFEPGRPILLA